MSRTILIDLTTEDSTRKARARTIAVNEATDLISAAYVGERGNLLEVNAGRIDAATVVDRIRRNGGLPNARLISVVDH